MSITIGRNATTHPHGKTLMDTDGSVTHWLHQLGGGDAAAAQPLWERYFDRLAHAAGRNLRGAPRRAADEEDVALSAFASFCRGAAQGRYPQLSDRTELWDLLVLIATRKSIDLVRRECRQKRGGGWAAVEATPTDSPSSAAENPVERVVGREPTPEFAALVAEEYHRLLDLLRDGELRQMAIWKMEGFTNAEIADKIERSEPTVERRLKRIRKIWEQESGR